MRKTGESITTAAVIMIALLNSGSQAGLREDVLAFTGNVRAKMVWVRAPKENAENHYNGKPNSTLMCYSTDDSAPRTLDPIVGGHNLPFISRNGGYVFWFSYGSAAYAVDWGGSDKKTILTKAADTAYMVVAVQWDENARKEYLYASTQAPTGSDEIWIAGQKLYRMEFANGSVNKATKKCVLDLTSQTWQGLIPNASDRWSRILPMLVSGDGKYAVANQPWPNIWQSDLTGGTDNTKLATGGEQACHPNIAPDNSHWVFHLNADHNQFRIFTSAKAIPASTNTDEVWWVDVANKLSGIQVGWDLSAPRWSNNIQYFSVGAPLTGMTEATSTARFYIGKFSGDFKSVTGYCITPNSTTRDKVGDLWLENGVGPGQTRVSKTMRLSNQKQIISISRHEGTIIFNGSDRIEATLYNAVGRIVSSYPEDRGRSWAIKNANSGTFFLRVQLDRHQWGERIVMVE